MKSVKFKGTNATLAVGKILCLGRNYAKHIDEMKGTLPEEPMLFLKPSTSLVSPGEPIRLPHFSSEVHHEVELVVVIGKQMRDVSEDAVPACVAGYAVGLDLTARDRQAEAKKRGGPWAVSKGFDGSAPVSEVTPAEEVGDPSDLAIELSVNGETRQSGRTSEMIFKIPYVLAYASKIFTLEPGDLFFTGTPAGVSPIKPGDVLKAAIERVGIVDWQVEK